MKAMVNVGHDFTKGASLKDTATAICQILEAAHEFRHDERTVQLALEAFKGATSIGSMSINNSSFYGGPLPDEDDE